MPNKNATQPIAAVYNPDTKTNVNRTQRTAVPKSYDPEVFMGSVSVGTNNIGERGDIIATGNITAYYSDDRMKTRLNNIENALDKVRSMSGFLYHANDVAAAMGYDPAKIEMGVSAQETQAALGDVNIVVSSPVDQNYLTVRYDRLVPLLIEAIKELDQQVQALKNGTP